MWARSFKSRKLACVCLGLLLMARAFAADKRGQALFSGKEPLTGKIREHETALPPEVLVCANCHATAQGKKLDRSYLLEPRQRRGGPPSSYSEAKFCRLLRTGVDPAYILIAREMPVYTLTDAQCASLWRYLTGNASS